jgi:AAA+ superfamily predicted ATPase
MTSFLSSAAWLVLSAALGAGTALAIAAGKFRRRKAETDRILVSGLIRSHFQPMPLGELTISERRFPFRVRADLQRTIDRLFGVETAICHFCGVRKEYSHDGVELSGCLIAGEHNAAVSVPPQYEEIDVGDPEPVRCLKNGLWFLQQGDCKFVVLLAPVSHYQEVTGLQFQIATLNNPEGTRITREFFKHLEESVLKAESYRGKILSLETSENSYSGESTGIKVHKLRTVERDQVILPRKALELLDRNVIQFVRQRSRLAAYRLSTKKGILFYGPPGTGKTHTIHYLARFLEGHTTLLVTAEQVGILGEYMTLARLLQPSIVVMEDVDLIESDRTKLGTCEEALLNKLLNEMDGLNEEADILFILTTNRPEALEQALTSRPGRVDQAIEFPLPDEEGREKLIRLYAQNVKVSDEVVSVVVRKTEKVSAAFIKELMRRSVQFQLERDGDGGIELVDVESALDEMLFSGGSVNLKLLGAQRAESDERITSNGSRS